MVIIDFKFSFLKYKCLRDTLSILGRRWHTASGNRRVGFRSVYSKNFLRKRVLQLSSTDHSPMYQLDRKCSTSDTITLSSANLSQFLKEFETNVEDDEKNTQEDIEFENQEDVMADEIIDCFLSRAISYEELESSFMIVCPLCKDNQKSHEMFIDKNSGYSVCPSCCWDGKFEDLINLLDMREDCLMEVQLRNFLFSLKAVEACHLDVLKTSFGLKLSLSVLRNVSAGITEDQSQIIIPLKGIAGKVVGFASLNLLRRNPKIVVRLLEGESAIFINAPSSNRVKKQVTVVSCIVDALFLAKLNYWAAVLLSNPSCSFMKEIIGKPKKVNLWLENRKVSRNLLSYLKMHNIDSYAIKTGQETKISFLSSKRIKELMENSIPILSDCLLSFKDIQDKVHDRLVNKENILGVQWKRFQELNHILLGHRTGELTIFSGPTGAGKTTFMSEYSLDLCLQGVPTLWGSFEVGVTRFCEVMLQQYYGAALPTDKSTFKLLANEFSKLPLFFLSYHGQVPVHNVISVMSEAVLTKGVRHIILDNLQFMLGTNGNDTLWWLEQDRTVSAFRNFATELNCHVSIIVHPKKLLTGEKLNMNSISGGARVTQEADNVLILHSSVNKDGSIATNRPKVLQVIKNRYGGTLGEIRLSFHLESKTLSPYFCQVRKKSEIPDRKDSGICRGTFGSDAKGLPANYNLTT